MNPCSNKPELIFWFKVMLGGILVLFGIYLILWQNSVVLHIDAFLSDGVISDMLTIASNSDALTAVDNVRQKLIEKAYNEFIPTLFMFGGSAVMLVGALLLNASVHQRKFNRSNK